MNFRSVFPLLLLFLVFSEGCSTSRQAVIPSRIAGTWLKPINMKPPSGKPGKEGFTLNTDGTITFVNIHSMTGDTWKLESDTLFYWSHTERYPEPQCSKFLIMKLTSSQLELKPVKNAHGYSLVYKRKK